MKTQCKIIFFVLLLTGSGLYAQEGRMGVGTENPTRTLHVQGDAQVKGLQSTTSGAYNEMLVSDADGNIEYANLWTVNPTRKRVWHLQYAGTGPAGRAISDNILQAGRFEFRFENVPSGNDHGRIQFRLAQNPGQTVRVYVNMEENWGDGSPPPDGYEYSALPVGLEFTTTGGANPWNNWRYPISQSQSRIATGEMNELYLSYPNENAFYRVLVYRMTSGSNSIWIITAEEYGN